MIVGYGVRPTITTTGAASWEIRTDANTRFHVTEIGIFIGSATASTYGIGRPAARGVTPTTPKDFLPEDSADTPVAAFLQSAIAWGTPPTVPADFFKRIGLPGNVGAGIILTFSNLVIPVSGSLVVWNLSTVAATMDMYAEGWT